MDVDVLPIIRDVFRSVEKDNNDSTQRSKDSLEASLKILELVRIYFLSYIFAQKWFLFLLHLSPPPLVQHPY